MTSLHDTGTLLKQDTYGTNDVTSLQPNDTYHDNGKRHGQSGYAPEEGRRPDERQSTWVDPVPETISWNTAVKIDQQATEYSTVQSADETGPTNQSHAFASLRYK
jgi:hypothetical protein